MQANALPTHSWDTHVHVFNPEKYPYSLSRAYSPKSAPYEELLALNAHLSMTNNPQNLVLVQPSPYGTDNSLILDLLRNHVQASDGRQLRAIAVIDPHQVEAQELEEWDSVGVRGIRINVEASRNSSGGAVLVKAIEDTNRKLSILKRHWKTQLYISGADWDTVANTIRELPVTVIADHQGGMKGTSALPDATSDVTQQAGFASLISLAKAGKVFVKLSGFYRSSKLTDAGFDDLEPLIKAFAKEIPEQLIWGSDWPHTGSAANRSAATRDLPEPFRRVDNAAVLANIRKWLGQDLFEKVTVETPARLYA